MEKSKSTVRYFLEKTLKLIYANNKKGWRREIDMTVVKEKIKKSLVSFISTPCFRAKTGLG